MGVRKGIKISLIIGVIIILMIPLILISVGRNQLHDTGISQQELLFESEQPQRILAFFPHPDDEVTVSGTLMKMIDAGNEVILVCMTKGEAADTGGKYSREALALVRTQEMNDAAETIGASQLVLMDYADSGMDQLGINVIKAVADSVIAVYQPDVLVSYDSKVGLYGHPDHRLTGQAVEKLFLARKGNSGFTPTRLFQVTLAPKQIQIGLKLSKGFQENYPKDLSKGLPYPDFSVNTTKYFDRVLKVIYGHESQSAILRDLLPYHDKVPAFIYSRIFDREYFHEVK